MTINTTHLTAGPKPWIAMRNGILMLDRLINEGDQLESIDDVLFSHSPQWFSQVRLDYEFDPTADCPRWKSFLKRNLEGDPERIAIVQEFAGYMLLVDTSQQKFLAMEGEGANGKSVFCAAIEAMLGDRNVSHVPLELFGQRFALIPTLGRLANIVAECGELDRIAEGFLKAFTSGDVMSFERKFKSPIETAPTARLIVCWNNRPRFSDKSGGLWRRMLIIPWRIQIPEKEQIRGMDSPSWWIESGEMPGIFNWAVAGLARLRRSEQFTRSEISKEAIKDYQIETNSARGFLTEFYVESPGGGIPTQNVYAEYKTWCGANSYRPFGESGFGREVKRTFPNSGRQRVGKREDRHYVYVGITWGNPEDQHLEKEENEF